MKGEETNLTNLSDFPAPVNSTVKDRAIRMTSNIIHASFRRYYQPAQEAIRRVAQTTAEIRLGQVWIGGGGTKAETRSHPQRQIIRVGWRAHPRLVGETQIGQVF